MTEGVSPLRRFAQLCSHVRSTGQRPSPDELYYFLRKCDVAASSAREVVLNLARRGHVRLPKLTSMELFLTESCNLGCKYCFVEGKNNKNRMTPAMALKATDFLFDQAKDAPQTRILFFGGEPLLEYRLIREVVDYARSRRMKEQLSFDITSNGLLITDEMAKYFADNGVAVLLSIDGDEATHDTYRRTLGDKGTFAELMKCVEVLRRHQPVIGAKVTVMPEFGAHVYENVVQLAARGVGHFLVGHATGAAWSVDQVRSYGESLKLLYQWWRRQGAGRRPVIEYINRARERKPINRRHIYGCRAGRSTFVVNPRGNIYACSKMLGANGLTGILPLGSLDEGITDVETRMTLCGFVPPERPACWACHQQTDCQGGCYAVNFKTTGDPFTCGEECKMIVESLGVEEFIRNAERETFSRVCLSESVK